MSDSPQKLYRKFCIIGIKGRIDPHYSEGSFGSLVEKKSSNQNERRNKRSLGTKHEQIAAEYLKTMGYLITETNFRCRQGEIDLIARDGEYLVFVEVKYRTDGRAGEPEEAVTPAKSRTIIKVARFYLYCHRLPETTKCRFDVVAIKGDKVRVIKNAFGLDGY